MTTTFLADLIAENESLRASNKELLEALDGLVRFTDDYFVTGDFQQLWDKARAVIAKAKAHD